MSTFVLLEPAEWDECQHVPAEGGQDCFEAPTGLHFSIFTCIFSRSQFKTGSAKFARTGFLVRDSELRQSLLRSLLCLRTSQKLGKSLL